MILVGRGSLGASGASAGKLLWKEGGGGEVGGAFPLSPLTALGL